jgi:hypothetical protein
MKRNNLVILSGELKPLVIKILSSLFLVECRLTTDVPALGGHHLVMTDNKLAREILAFELAVRSLDTVLIATVQGWLFSAQGQTRVIAEHAYFHVSPDVRSQAAQVIRSLPEPLTVLPASVSVNGTKLKTSELLKDVHFG